MGFTSDTFTHLFDWEKDPQRQEKIVNARLESEFDGIDAGLSSLSSRVTALEAGGGTRELLTANRTYYIRTDGNDNNTGLVDSAGGAFLTIQKAINVVAATLDISGFTVTIQVRDGAYLGAVQLKNVVGFAAPGNLVITGNASTPTNVLINVTGTAIAGASLFSVWDISNLKVQSSGYCILASSATVRFDNLNFGSSGASHIIAINGGKVLKSSFSGNYTISGSAATAHAQAQGAGSTIDVNGGTHTLTGTPTFTYWFWASSLGEIQAQGVTWSGSGTGQEYLVNVNGILNTNGNLAAIPGATSGTTSTGGQAL